MDLNQCKCKRRNVEEFRRRSLTGPTTSYPPQPGMRKAPIRVEYAVINLDTLQEFDGTEVTPEALRSRGLVRKQGLVSD